MARAIRMVQIKTTARARYCRTAKNMVIAFGRRPFHLDSTALGHTLNIHLWGDA